MKKGFPYSSKKNEQMFIQHLEIALRYLEDTCWSWTNSVSLVDCLTLFSGYIGKGFGNILDDSGNIRNVFGYTRKSFIDSMWIGESTENASLDSRNALEPIQNVLRYIRRLPRNNQSASIVIQNTWNKAAYFMKQYRDSRANSLAAIELYAEHPPPRGGGVQSKFMVLRTDLQCFPKDFFTKRQKYFLTV